jgi:hypothetical protein
MAGDAPTVVVACCGLVCSDCGAYRKGRCQGCHGEKPMFRNCPVKACVKFRSFATCADCTAYPDLTQCGKLHNFISRIFAWIFRSDRVGNLNRIRQLGLEPFKAQNPPKPAG